MAEDDTRDEGLGRLLDVEPLDELTRRRLVTTAVRASAPPSRSRRWVAAAVVVVVLAVGGGVALFVGGGDDTSAPTALNDLGKSATPNTTPPNASLNDQSSASEQAPPSAGATSTPPAYAGDVGDLAVAANLAVARAKLSSPAVAADSRGPSESRLGRDLAADLAALPCADELPAGAVVALATGTFGTRPALVVVTDLPDGSRSVDAVVAEPCEVRPLD